MKWIPLTLRFCLLLCITACTNPKSDLKEKQTFEGLDVQGHRGCRGLMPENTIPAFITAVELGVNTLELDVCISADNEVVVSHEPWLSAEICSLEDQIIDHENQKQFNLFKLTYQEIRKADCGSKPVPRFPEQEKLSTYKPLLSEVIDTIQAFCKANQLPVPYFNIETKLTPSTDNEFHPTPEAFSDLVLAVVRQKKIESTVCIQSFDFRVLEYLHAQAPEITLAALVENTQGVKANLAKLSFKPTIYSPYFKLITPADIDYLKSINVQIKPWTVNELDDIRHVLALGVDGIITDYPDRVNAIIGR